MNISLAEDSFVTQCDGNLLIRTSFSMRGNVHNQIDILKGPTADFLWWSQQDDSNSDVTNPFVSVKGSLDYPVKRRGNPVQGSNLLSAITIFLPAQQLLINIRVSC